MWQWIRAGVAVWVAGLMACACVQAAEPARPAASEIPRVDREDAALRDVFFTSPRTGFAVGDRGTILRTDDGGQSWTLLPCETDASLRSISFVSEQEGWIAGGGTREYSGETYGVVLVTQDGGESWTIACGQGIPTIRRIQFFSDAEGIAVGDATSRLSTGLLSTADAGRTWAMIPGDESTGWTAGEFASLQFAVLVGERGAVGALSGGSVVKSTSLGGLRGFRASSLDRSAKSVWAVGDGGMIVRSNDGGATWPAADGTLPPETKMVFDFSAVAALNNQVWVGGTPGSVIWHSPDAGVTWAAQPTGETTPLYAIRSLKNGRKVAVGALGKILISDGDGPWTTVRGARRRLAALAVHAHGSRVSLLELGRDAQDRGYRVGSWSLVRRDVEPGTDRPAHGTRRLEDAVISLGGACGTTDWRLPVSLPGLDRNPQALMAEWSVLADQKLNDVLVATIATQIRTWRPDVLLLDDAPADDTPTQVIHAALAVATGHARMDQGRMTPLWKTAGLPEWNVKRVYSRSLNGREGDLSIDPF
ncbi:MAG TPA: YCF48-related protein, partial [Caulifigura sp.]|nr:YCF48-related protein [Caulifigura sp.]